MLISKMDECIHKIKPPNFGGFFVASLDTPTAKAVGFLRSVIAYATLILKGLAKSPLHSSSKSKFCLLFLRMFAAPFRSAFAVLPSAKRYRPRRIRFPLNEPVYGCSGL